MVCVTTVHCGATHWLGKKFKLQMPEVMRRYRQGNTFGTSTTQLVLPTKYKNKRLQFRLATNPYTGNTVPEYEEVVDLEQLWTGIENRPGSLDRKEEVSRRDGGGGVLNVEICRT